MHRNKIAAIYTYSGPQGNCAESDPEQASIESLRFISICFSGRYSGRVGGGGGVGLSVSGVGLNLPSSGGAQNLQASGQR